jgi:hypothetical protein
MWSILHSTVMFYSDSMKMCEDFMPKFDDKSTSSCIMTTNFFTREFLTKKNDKLVSDHIVLVKEIMRQSANCKTNIIH